MIPGWLSSRHFRGGLGLVLAIALAFAFWRDMQVSKRLPCDLRARIVGSRLIKDGKLPYFYKWRPEDGIRYYNPQDFNGKKVSEITSSPFFLQLLTPLAEEQQSRINGIYRYIQYAQLAILLLLALLLSSTALQKMLAFLFTISFLYTDAWKQSIESGQSYLWIPFLAMIVLFALNQGKKRSALAWAFLGGLAAISLVLIRINTAVFFVPMLFLYRRWSLRWRLLFLLPVVLLTGWAVGSPRQRALWSDYQKALPEHIRKHQGLDPALLVSAPDPHFSSWEGIDGSGQSFTLYPENGNFFYLYTLVTHRRLSLPMLTAAALLTVLLILAVWRWQMRAPSSGQYSDSRWRIRGQKPSRYPSPRGPGPTVSMTGITQTALLGFGLYMVLDLFSPVYRLQYYTVQVLFLLLTAAAMAHYRIRAFYFAFGVGILLNFPAIPFVKMPHTVGEYSITAAAILLCLYRPESQMDIDVVMPAGKGIAEHAT